MTNLFNNVTPEQLAEKRLRRAKRCQLLGHTVKKVDGLWQCKQCDSSGFKGTLTQYKEMNDQSG